LSSCLLQFATHFAGLPVIDCRTMFSLQLRS
jgi:hypothetical protein